MAAEAASDWKQWMRWDGEGEDTATANSGDNQPPSFDLPSLYPITPLSPSQDFETFLTAPQSSRNEPPTPSYSNSSPETLHLPEQRLSGDTLRGTMSSRSSRQSLKRKSSDVHDRAAEAAATTTEKPAPKKRPHNIIEKRYRANINEKIADLRKSIPSLRGPKETKSENASDDEEGDSGSKPLNKAFILTKAVDYIRHLELRNRKLDDENLALKTRLCRLEKVVQSDSTRTEQHLATVTSETAVEAIPEELTEAEQKERSARHPPEGLISTPDSWKKLRQNQPQEHYGARYDNPQEGRPSSRKWPARFMLGSLAGLMVLDGLAESQDGSDSKKKGLFGIPVEFMDGWWFLRSPEAFISAFMQYCRAGGVIPLVKGFLALSLLAFFIFSYLFNSKPTRENSKPSEPVQIPSLASPVQVRRQAWFTSMQTLKLPSHTFFAEWLAVNLEWLKYTVRLIFGFRAYYKVTGRSGDDELARIKAWDIAMDAQLAGGDPDISRSRLLLSIFASGTLPKSPQRLMLKALHARVIFWRIGYQGGLISSISKTIALFLAKLQWAKAQRLAETLRTEDGDGLAPHLAELLRLECDEVMLDNVLDRVCDLMYGRSIDEAASDSLSSLMDVVVEDHAISSPLDAIAAWWSTTKLHEALLLSLADDDHSQLTFKTTLGQALAIAPPLSTAHIRALAIHAVFFEHGRAGHAQRVLDALPQSSTSTSTPMRSVDPIFIDSSIPSSACLEIQCVLQCIQSLSSTPLTSNPSTPSTSYALTLSPASTILSTAPIIHLLHHTTQHHQTLSPHLTALLPTLTPWIHRHASLIPAHTMARIVQLLWKVTPPPPEPREATQDAPQEVSLHIAHPQKPSRRDSVASHDTGYASLTEVEDEEEVVEKRVEKRGWIGGARGVEESVFSLV